MEAVRKESLTRTLLVFVPAILSTIVLRTLTPSHSLNANVTSLSRFAGEGTVVMPTPP
jgi:hypothetical protein